MSARFGLPTPPQLLPPATISDHGGISFPPSDRSTVTNISVTTRGKRHLGVAIGSGDFATEYISRKVEEWCKELMSLLAKIAESQPHAVFATFNHGMISKWTYVCRTIPEIDDLLWPLDEVIIPSHHRAPYLLSLGTSATCSTM